MKAGGRNFYLGFFKFMGAIYEIIRGISGSAPIPHCIRVAQLGSLICRALSSYLPWFSLPVF